ncbi:MAG: Ribonuclease HII [Candidatus Thorarchaeota archaeon]|nr:MAG: Ribonuclease HII [Candidatus Thorarchaeota archaeon]
MLSEKPSLFGTAGVDEAGRGPMIGPLVVCGVLFDDDALRELEVSDVRDSKTLSPKRREQLAEIIESHAARICTVHLSAAEIDEQRGRGITLNELGVRKFIEVLQELRPTIAYVDAADVKAQRFGDTIGQRSGLWDAGCNIVSEHKADVKYPIVSAASIMAKVERDRMIARFHEDYGDFGSGYPSDEKSVNYVRELVLSGQDIPVIVRRSWESVRRIITEYETKQTTLGY